MDDHIQQKELESEWPPSVVALVGAWKDFPSLEEIRKTAVFNIPENRQQLLDSTNIAYAKLHEDTPAWKAHQKELAAWDVTVADGLLTP